MMWQPTPQQIEDSNLNRFMAYVNTQHKAGVESYSELHRWSLSHVEAFWGAVWDFCGVVGSYKDSPVLETSQGMFKAQFFPEAKLNFAENLLNTLPQGEVMVFWGEDKAKRCLSSQDLIQQVANLARYLKLLGVEPGDRVAGFVPNTPEAIIAMLAATSLGGVWSSCSPDFGVEGVLDRFGQIEPKVLFLADGYYYGGKSFDCLGKLGRVLKGLPTVKHAIVFPYAGTQHDLGEFAALMTWEDALEKGEGEPVIDFTPMPFNHPLYILFSSGTTGAPKCIVHTVGGTLLQHLKEHQLHCDIKAGDRVFYFTTCGWMMWNWQVSALASGATLLLYDGSPGYPHMNILFDYAEAETMTLFGTSAKYIDALHKEGLEPIKTHDLSSLRMMTSTGSPLVPESFDYVYESIATHICLASISGGSDIVSCFVLGCPVLPVHRGEIQAAGLGLDVDVYTQDGQSADMEEKGELVCKVPFPCQPLGFWNDEGDTKYKAAYFERFPGIWCHGDYVAKTKHGGFVIYGRSDATLNPGGVRIGTAEIYRQVEQFDEVLESLVVGQDWEGDVRVILFVKLREGSGLTEDLIKSLKSQIRTGASPRHVPAKVIAVSDIPRTKSGKTVELAVRDVIHGREVKNLTALANPEALDLYKGLEVLES